jgi:tRNA pseudouridine13 synthase
LATLPNWARALGEPLCSCRIRSTPSDFIVTELLDFELSGEGEHDWLWIEKIGANTSWVAGQLAKHAGVHARDVGYAGLKDRHAVTKQWFSVRRKTGEGTDWDSLSIEGVELIECHRHQRKLKRGAHRGNTFQIALRGDDIDRLDEERLVERLRRIAEGGVPNYFGEQRFGREAGNVELGRAVLAGKRFPRNKRSIGISAIRSLQFNDELSARVEAGTWNQILANDTANLDGSGSVFVVDELTAEIEQRCSEMDIHPCGTLPAIDKIDVEAAHRPLRMRVGEIGWQRRDDAVWLELQLPKGAFATTVLRELVGY